MKLIKVKTQRTKDRRTFTVDNTWFMFPVQIKPGKRRTWIMKKNCITGII